MYANNAPQPVWPPVAGFSGPNLAPDGTPYYTEVATGQNYGVEVVFPTVNGYTGPVQNTATGLTYYTDQRTGQTIDHAALMNMLQNGNRSQPNINHGYQQPAPVMGQQLINQGQRTGAPPNIYKESGGHSAVSSGINLHASNISHIPKTEPVKPDEPVQPYGSLLVGSVASVMVGELHNDIPAISHNTSRYGIVPLIDNQKNIIDVIYDKGRVNLNKNEHVVPNPLTGIEKVEDVVKKPNAGAPVLPQPSAEEIPNCVTIDLATETIDQAAVIARHYNRIGKPCITRFTSKHIVALVDGSSEGLSGLVEGYWVDKYHQNIKLLTERHPDIVEYLNTRLRNLVNDILTSVINIDTQITSTYLEDEDELIEYLESIDKAEEFLEALHKNVKDELELSIECMLINEVEVDILTTQLSSVIAVADVEPLDDLTVGKIAYNYTPLIYEAANRLRLAVNTSPYEYHHVYIAGKHGGVIKLSTLSNTVPELSTHRVVEIIR